MKAKINVTEVCKAYNSAREQNSGRKGDSKWITDILKSFGISGTMAKKMIGQSTLFQQFHRENAGKGNHKGYIFPQTPVHVTWFQNWIYPSKRDNAPVKKEQSFEEECKEFLEKNGYLVQRVEFNEKAFKADHYELWKKYLIPIK